MGIIGEQHWNLHLVGGTVRRLWTRARLDFVSERSDEAVPDGYFCEVPVQRRDWRETLAVDETVGDTPEDAIARFAAYNGGIVDRLGTLDGVVMPFASVVVT